MYYGSFEEAGSKSHLSRPRSRFVDPPQLNLPQSTGNSIRSRSPRDSIDFSNSTIPLSSDEAAKVVRKHLVLPGRNKNVETSSMNSSSSGSLLQRQLEPSNSALALQGGAITREIYRWQFAHESSVRMKRSNSFPGLMDQEPDDSSDRYNAHEILLPGGFRRHFVQQKAYAEGRTPNLITRSFIDFLALYGHFAGEDYPSDEDDDVSEQGSENASINHPLNGSGFSSPLLNEASPLLPVERRKAIHQTPATSSKVLFLLIKSFLGAGVLFLPRAFYNGGMILSSIIVVAVSLVGLYSLMLLIECHRLLGGSYAEIANRLYGKHARYIISASVLFSQFGYCIAYTIFVAKNIHELILSFSNCKLKPSEGFLIFAQLIIYIPMSMVRKIKYFSMAAFFGDIFIISGLSYLYYFDINELIHAPVKQIDNFNPAGIALMAGTAIFAFEGVGLVLPIAESMEEPRRFPRLLGIALLFSTFVLLTVGSLSYAAFGEKVDVVVLRNLPAAEPMSQTIRLIYSLAVSFAVPLQLFPAIRILEMCLFPRASGKAAPGVKWKKNFFRTLLALTLATLAYGGARHLEKLVAFFGAIFCLPLYFIFPALLHRKALKSLPSAYLHSAPVSISNSPYQTTVDFLMILLGAGLSLALSFFIWHSPPSMQAPLDFCNGTSP
ncbi:hypothetical protein DSO57_1020576 [Entomophthora muscae]|uniref:Uncharacterized protein n=1 Tax=Entomophthora muscae TaxID=34485 RepID=A0ACC2U1I7_9FUNG|nr:hypothetical protein DSO57_1020576 [Entomophthora muscae]